MGFLYPNSLHGAPFNILDVGSGMGHTDEQRDDGHLRFLPLIFRYSTWRMS